MNKWEALKDLRSQTPAEQDMSIAKARQTFYRGMGEKPARFRRPRFLAAYVLAGVTAVALMATFAVQQFEDDQSLNVANHRGQNPRPSLTHAEPTPVKKSSTSRKPSVKYPIAVDTVNVESKGFDVLTVLKYDGTCNLSNDAPSYGAYEGTYYVYYTYNFDDDMEKNGSKVTSDNQSRLLKMTAEQKSNLTDACGQSFADEILTPWTKYKPTADLAADLGVYKSFNITDSSRANYLDSSRISNVRNALYANLFKRFMTNSQQRSMLAKLGQSDNEVRTSMDTIRGRSVKVYSQIEEQSAASLYKVRSYIFVDAATGDLIKDEQDVSTITEGTGYAEATGTDPKLEVGDSITRIFTPKK